MSNVHKLKDLDQTFKALEKVAEAVVNGVRSVLLSTRAQNQSCTSNVGALDDTS